MIDKAKVIEAIKELSDCDAVELWNNYCCEIDGSGDYIYQMGEFDDVITESSMKPWDTVRACYYGLFCPANNYFWFNGYNNLQSCDFPKDDNSGSPFDADAIADYIAKNNDSLNCDDIQMVLNENKA